MFNSKLSPTKYPCILDMNEVRKYVSCSRDIDLTQLDPVFLGRFAAMCRDLKIIGHVISGFRDHQKQIQLYKASGGKQDALGAWYGGSPKVARPGNSWHEFRLAIDISTPMLKALEKAEATAKQVTWMKYGLFKPLTAGNKTSIFEDWHIQPIETKGCLNKASLAPDSSDTVNMPTLKMGSKGEAVKEMQTLLVKKGYALTIDGAFGPATKDRVETFQRAKGLTPDGSVGPQTWKALRG